MPVFNGARTASMRFQKLPCILGVAHVVPFELVDSECDLPAEHPVSVTYGMCSARRSPHEYLHRRVYESLGKGRVSCAQRRKV